MKTRCQILQNTVNTIKSIKYEADKQQMIIIVKSHWYSSCFVSSRWERKSLTQDKSTEA